MQIIKGKHYNDYEMGGFILLVPVYGKQGHMLALGELKDLFLKLKEIGKIAHEANRQMYLEAREKYVVTQKRLDAVEHQLAILLRSSDIDTIETKRLLSEEKRKLESDLYYLSEQIDQLFDKSFVPERKVEEKIEPELTSPPQLSLHTHDYTQTHGYKVRQLRKSLGETQAQFASHFNIHPVHVSLWENNKEEPPKEVLELQPAPSSASEVEQPQESLGNAKN